MIQFCNICIKLKITLMIQKMSQPKMSPTNAKKPVKIAIGHGDGIGPEIMKATLKILKEAGANIETETIHLGEKIYLAGNTAGIEEAAWDTIDDTKIILKEPHYHASRKRVQKPECNFKKISWTFCQCTTSNGASSIRKDTFS